MLRTGRGDCRNDGGGGQEDIEQLAPRPEAMAGLCIGRDELRGRASELTEGTKRRADRHRPLLDSARHTRIVRRCMGGK
jgi:hypothetical protein